LAQRYGAYASYRTDADPVRTEFHGDAPADEMDRLLELFARPDSRVLDLGCGAGQTLCRLAPRVAEIWGIDCEQPLLAGAQARVAHHGLKNVTLVHGDTTHAEAVAQLPDNTCDFAFSRRGPFLNAMLMPKLKPDAHFVHELYVDCPGLKEIFGRRAFLPGENSSADAALAHHIKLGLLPVSIKDYFYSEYFRDADHLAAYLSRGAWLSNWWMPEKPYDPARDRPALNLYARYNTTRQGIRLIQHRKIYLFHRAQVHYYPVDGTVSDRGMDA
jgi:SAM-dependent methyltransferase